MKKSIIATLLLTTIAFTSNGQIESEIKAFVDSAEQLVQNGRRLILKELDNNNTVKVLEIYDYLTLLTNDKHFAAFYYVEDIYITMLTNDWLKVEELVINYDMYKGKRIYPNSPELVSKLYQITSSRFNELLESSKTSSMRNQTKRVIEVLLYYISKGKADETYNKLLKAYQKDYKDTPYKSFEKEFLPPPAVRASIAFSMGSGMLIPTGNLATNFKSNALYVMTLDININRIYTSLYMQGSDLKLKVPFNATSSGMSLDFSAGERFTYFEGGLRAGYFTMRGNRLHLVPYISLSGSKLESNKFDDPDDNDLEFNVFNSFTCGIGAHSEIKLFSFTSRSYYYGGEIPYYISLKLDAGYNKVVKHKYDNFKGDTPYLNVAIVLGFGDF